MPNQIFVSAHSTQLAISAEFNRTSYHAAGCSTHVKLQSSFNIEYHASMNFQEYAYCALIERVWYSSGEDGGQVSEQRTNYA